MLLQFITVSNNKRQNMQLDALSIALNREDNRTYVKVELVHSYYGRCFLVWATDSQVEFEPDSRYWSTYSSQQLNVARTRSRVIYRFLKDLMPNLEPVASLPSGDYFRSFRLSGETQQFRPEVYSRYFASKNSTESLRPYVNEALAHCRSYGSRPNRLTKLRPVQAKPDKFKEMWKAEYHDKDMGTYDSEETTFGLGNFRMGVELECMTRGKIFGDECYMYRSYDGSIGSGSEFVTRPDSAAVHVKELGVFLEHNSVYPHSSCGMHVHVDRRQLTNDAINLIAGRMFEARRRDFYIKYVAGRHPTTYCTLERRNLGTKYCALNTGRRGTIEFRWFSSTNKIRVIQRRLKWINAICTWACKKAGVVAPATPPTPEQEYSIRQRARAEIFRRYGSEACTCGACIDSMIDENLANGVHSNL